MSLRRTLHTPESMESLREYVNHYDGQVKGTYIKKSEKVFWGLYDLVADGDTPEQHVRFRDSLATSGYGIPQGICVDRLIKSKDVARGAVSLLGRRSIRSPQDCQTAIPKDPAAEDILKRRESEILDSYRRDGWVAVHGSFDYWPELPNLDDEPDLFTLTDRETAEMSAAPSFGELSLGSVIRHIRENQ